MERGLLWLPLLVIFSWLSWMGWNEYQKIEAYRRWAEQFERAKYDIYSVLGQKGSVLTWGKPTRSGPVDLQSFSLESVQSLCLLVNEQPVALESPPQKGAAKLQFILIDRAIAIPFTEVSLAAEWARYLQQNLERGWRG
jgi:hypothetical protein